MLQGRRSGSVPFGEGRSIARSRKSSPARAAGRFRADRRCTPAASCRAASGEIALCGENASPAYGHKRPRPPAPDEAVPKRDPCPGSSGSNRPDGVDRPRRLRPNLSKLTRHKRRVPDDNIDSQAKRDHEFESAFLQRRVSCEPEAGTVTVGIFALGPTGLTGSQERAEYPATPGLTRRMSVKSKRKEAH